MKLSQLERLLDILAALAAADGQTDDAEAEKILDLLVPLGLESGDRDRLLERLHGFDPSSFNLEAAAIGLGPLSDDERDSILSIVEQVEEADGVIDLEEELFLQQLARALGLDEEAIQAMTIQISEHHPSQPPPLPLSSDDPSHD